MAIIDGRTVVDKGIVSFPDNLLDNESVIQPNGVDLRVNKIWHMTGRSVLARDKKIDTKELQINEISLNSGYFKLPHLNGHYLVDFREKASLRDGYCAIIVPRSSLLRAGVFVTSALWDTGFEGKLGAVMRVRNSMDIEYGSTLAQLVVSESEFNGHRYEGSYKHKDSYTAVTQ